MIRIRKKYKRRRKPLVVVYFEKDSNFNPNDLSWTPRKKELSEIYKEMKDAGAWR